MATPALLMRTSSMSTSLTASWICEALVTSRVKGVTRLSECCSTPRVPAYTFLAPVEAPPQEALGRFLDLRRSPRLSCSQYSYLMSFHLQLRFPRRERYVPSLTI